MTAAETREARPSLAGTRVCMFVRNTFEFDARVEREARALAAAGAAVTVVALWDADRTPRRERRGPIEVRRVSRWFWLVDKLRAAWVRRAKPEGGGEPDASVVTAGLNTMQRSWTVVRQVGPMARIRDLAITARMAAVGVATRAGVFHAHDLNTLQAATWAARLRRARLVYDSHEVAPGQENIGDHEATEAKERALIGRADAVIHVTPMRAAWAARTYGIPMPAVLLNVPDVPPEGVEPLDLAAAYGLPAGSKVLVHPGGMQPNRGLEALVGAVPLLDPSFALVFAGYGRLRPALEKLVAELGVADRVRFTGAIPHEELMRHVAGAWCGFSLLVDTCENHRWSLPNKLFESLAVGVPVIVSDNEEIAAFVRDHGVGEACDPTDAASVAEAVRRLEARYGEARDAAAAVSGKYRWSAESAKLLSVYEPLVARRAAAAAAGSGGGNR